MSESNNVDPDEPNLNQHWKHLRLGELISFPPTDVNILVGICSCMCLAQYRQTDIMKDRHTDAGLSVFNVYNPDRRWLSTPLQKEKVNPVISK